MASKRVERLCSSISRMLEDVSIGHTLRSAEQVGPDAVIVRRTGLRGDATPGITIEIMPNSSVPAEETKYAPLLVDEDDDKGDEAGNEDEADGGRQRDDVEANKQRTQSRR